ncbi:IclR family transcriptional regulator [Paenibacillus antri]|uniref:Glycerol operon regulatory protein n=1 Tax=Paenibacillus antri TaxID=2582848 RepID=A0A5R9G8C9_9BACL|nr:IclR family transcriptional regulator [Paenibacillus antri]TLS52652.1 IclR family transcriptional regulator [Paenibacillus antri]
MPLIQSVQRALQIVDLFDERTPELKITEISARMQLHKSTVHSLLKTLMHHGYIAQDDESGKYRLGLALVEKGNMLLQSMDLRSIAKPYIAELSAKSGQTTHLVVLDGRDGVYIDKVEGAKAAIRYSRIGRRVPLHSSAVGKALAAFRPLEALHALLDDYTFDKRTERTIGDREAFLAELTRVRGCGFAIDDEENEPGVRCAAAPIFDHSGVAAAAISVSTMTSSVDDDALRALIDELLEAAKAISRQLGYKG